MRKLIYVLACTALIMAILPASGFAGEVMEPEESCNTSASTELSSPDEATNNASETNSQQEALSDGSVIGDAEDELEDDLASAQKDGENKTQPDSTIEQGNENGGKAVETEENVVDESAVVAESTTTSDSDNETDVSGGEPTNEKQAYSEEAHSTEISASVAPEAHTVTVSTKLAVVANANTKPAKKASSSKNYLANNAIYYISSALGKKGAWSVSLKDIYGKAKTNVVLAKKVKQLIQYWRVETKGDGIYRFVNCASGYYLAVKGTVKSQANVYVAKNGSIDWKLKKYDDGTFSLRPANGEKVYLSVAGGAASKGANIRLWGAVSNNGQKFMIVKSKRLTGVFAKGQTVAPGIVKVKSNGSKTPIYVTNSSTSNNLKMAAAADSLKQVYQLRYRGNGLYEFQNAYSYKVPTIYKNSKKVGAKVVQYKRMLGLNQLWYFKAVDGGYQLLSARSGLAIDIDGGKAVAGKVLKMAKPSKANTQKYTFEKTQLVSNGTYVLQSAMAMPLVLNVHGSSKDNGANVELNRSSGATGEQFKVKYLKNGNYRITNATTKKSIEVAGASKKNGANIQMATSTGNANQQWIIEVGDTGFMFKSALSGKYLNVNSSQAKSKANIDQRAASETANQCWTLASSDWKYYAGASSAAMKLIKKAETYEGWRYQWGGRDPSTSFDCAGLVMYCSNKAWGTHFDLMNTNAEMLYEMCTHISAKDAKPGDLVFYRGTYGNDITYISHVVIFTGKGYMYGAGDPIGYAKVNAVKNFKGKTATAVYARIRH